MIRLAHGAATDVGRIRSLNEDSLLETESLFAVADGMGGHRGGEVASATAVEALRTTVLEPNIDSLADAVQAANGAVFDQAQRDPELQGMGTTLCAIALVRDGADDSPAIGIVNVGDSRVYLLDGDRFAQLSEDHSLVETMVRGGQLSPDEAAVHPGRNVLTRALGIEPHVEVDCWTVALKVGDRFLLCSDGLFNELKDDQISTVLRTFDDPGAAAQELVDQARESGGRDNITAVIVDVVGDEALSNEGEIGDRLTRVSDDADDLGLEADEPRDPTSPVPTIPITTRKAADPAPGVMTPVIHRGERRRRRFTWRTGLFLLAIVAVLAVGFGAVVYAARSTYFVRADGAQVAVYRGRPGVLLWFDPTKVRDTDIATADVPPQYKDQVRLGHQVDSLTAANSYVKNIKGDIDTVAAATTTTTTTTLPGTVTTVVTTPVAPTTTVAPPGP